MRALFLDNKILKYNPNYPEPQLTGKYERVKVIKAGICNTDLELVKGYRDVSGVLGHEFVAVVETGELAGKRIAGEMNISCWNCPTCHAGMDTQCPNRVTVGMGHDGAFADYLLLPPENLHPLPDSISDDQAVFIEPLAAGLQTLHQTHISPHHRVVLIGAGKLGMLTAQVLSLTGCDLTVICRHSKQINLLKKWGIDTAMSGEIEARSVDVVVDCTGTDSGFADALEMVKPRGVIHLKSTYAHLPQTNLTRAVVDEIAIQTSRCGSFPAAIRLLGRGLIDTDSLIEARYSLDDALAAMEYAGKKGVLKVLLEM